MLRFLESSAMAYISITGFRAKSLFHIPFFIWHAIRSMGQAQKDPACLRASAKVIKGVAHTVTVWESRNDMVAYMRSGAHRDAMRAFPKIGTGYGFGFEGNEAPPWNEVHHLWLEKGPSAV